MPAKQLDRTPTVEAVELAAFWDCSFIMLGHGRFALLDRADAEIYSKWLWHFNRRGYAARLQYVRGQGFDDIIYPHRAMMVFLGRFREELKAVIAYNAWASKHFGEFAYLNPV